MSLSGNLLRVFNGIRDLRAIGSLRLRLILIVGLALAPLVLASIGQGFMRVDAHHKEVEQNLLSTALYATHNEQTIFPDAKQFMERLAQRKELTAGAAACQKLLEDSLIGAPQYINVAYFDANGRTICSAAPGQTSPDYKRFFWWQKMTARHDFIVGNEYHNSATGHDVLPVALPLYDDAGAFRGALSVSIDTHLLSRHLATNKLPKNAIVLLIDHTGNILASNKSVSDRLAKEVASLGRNNFGRTFVTRSDAAGKWRWAAQPIGRDDKLVAFGMPESWLMGITPMYIFADIFLPLLMILFAWVAIWLGTEWLVIRWTAYLKNISVAYGRGEFAVDTSELETAPDEFRLLGHEMKKMAQSIQTRDYKLSQALRQETSLAREIHHRVKNNLQVVSSLISLFSRKVAAPEARQAFRQIMARVDALSLVHRLVEKSGPLPVVVMGTLMSELVEQIQVSTESVGRTCNVELDVCDCQLPMDIATPIALFTVEALSSELSGAEDFTEMALLSLQADGQSHLLLSIHLRASGDASLQERVPPPVRVLTALAEQIGGRSWIEETGDGGYRVLLRIFRPKLPAQPRTPLDDDLGWGPSEKALTSRIYGAREK